MCTWNSNKPYFVKCLNSIKREIPVHHFILVDRFSNDGTVKVIKEIFPNAEVIKSNERLGVSRKLGIELVDTDFFAFVDSDTELCYGWFKRIISHIDPKTGAIQGIIADTFEPFRAWINWSRNIQARFKEIYRKRILVVTAENPVLLRGATHNTLVRTCLVKDWRPCAVVSAMEDHLLLRHIVRKGYNWKVLLDLTVMHYGLAYMSPKEWFTKTRWYAAGERLIRFDNMSIWSLIKRSSQQVISALLASLQTQQPMIFPYVIRENLARLQGWTGWNKYLELER
jgi:glycosyltransferase involved in cell wall biosynthesis